MTNVIGGEEKGVVLTNSKKLSNKIGDLAVFLKLAEKQNTEHTVAEQF